MFSHTSPIQRFLALCSFAALMAGGSVWIALAPPWLGLTMRAHPADGGVEIVAAPPGSSIPVGARAVALGDGTERQLPLTSIDLIEEPDFLDRYEEMEVFFSRQAALYALLQSSRLELHWWDHDGRTGKAVLTPGKRPLSTLPFAFWFQLSVGIACFLIAGWVYVLRPGEWGARMFALTGLAFPFSAVSAAIYSSRELALAEETFRLLSALNHFGATAFGMALVALFLCYPRSIVRPRSLLILPAVFFPWFLADILRWAPDIDWGVRIPLFLELSLAIGCAAWQWHLTRHDPLARAALRWLALSTLIGSSLFLILVPGHSLFGVLPPLSQADAFGFFLIMYLGIALGVGRYRLFDIDAWAYRIWLWVIGALLVIALDIMFVWAGMQQNVSLGAALILAGWLYFPLRQWLWRSVLRRHELRIEELLPQLADFALLPDPDRREAHWDSVLHRIFQPLEIHRGGPARAETAIGEDGLSLIIPRTGDLDTRQLHFADAGRRLFSSRDAQFAEAMRRLVKQVLDHRQSLEQGAQRERQRISRDLHDNLGTRLLRLIHHLRGSPDAELARDAMKELRAAITAIDAPPAPLEAALADWRAEIGASCSAAGVDFVWQTHRLPSLMLAARIKAAIGSILREATTNALRHATPNRIAIHIDYDGALAICVENDGVRLPAVSWREGYGLRNMRARMHDLGGTFQIEAEGGIARVLLRLPLPERSD